MQPNGRDIPLVYAIRSLRAFGFAALGVLLALYLPRFGLGAAALGAYLSLTVLTATGMNALLLSRVDRIGRRRVLALAAVLYALAGLALALARGPVLLVAAALFGTLPPGGDGLFSMAEQAIIGNVDASKRPAVFGRYGLAGPVAASAGLLAAGVPSLLSRRGGVPIALAERGGMAVYAVLGLGVPVLVLVLSLGPEVEAAGGPARSAPAAAAGGAGRPPAMGRSRGLLLRLAGLFAADSFGSAMVTVTLLAYGLHARFGLGAGPIALLLVASRAMASVPYPLAIWFGRRVGMINTAVWRHIPSSLLLAALALVGAPAGAAALLIARGRLVEMDVPTRQAFISGAVEPEERAAAAGITTLGRQVGQLAGPLAGGLALTLAAPVLFTLAAAVKSAYDLALWGLCRTVPESAGGAASWMALPTHPDATGRAQVAGRPPPNRFANGPRRRAATDRWEARRWPSTSDPSTSRPIWSAFCRSGT